LQEARRDEIRDEIHEALGIEISKDDEEEEDEDEEGKGQFSMFLPTTVFGAHDECLTQLASHSGDGIHARMYFLLVLIQGSKVPALSGIHSSADKCSPELLLYIVL